MEVLHMKRFYNKLIAIMVVVPILFSVCFPTKQAADFSKKRQNSPVCLFADDALPKPTNQA